MSPENTVAAYAALYGPSTESMRQSLPEIGEGLAAQLAELHKRPSPDAAEQLARNLDGARVAVMRYRERLVAEGAGDER